MATPVIRTFSLTGARGSFPVEVHSAGGARPAVVVLGEHPSLVDRLARAGFIVAAAPETSDLAVLLEELGGGGLSHRPTAIGVYGGDGSEAGKTPWLAAGGAPDDAGVIDWFSRRLA